MSVASCLAKMVASGALSQRVAKSALDLHTRMQAEFAPETGPSSAEAAAALVAAKALEARAADKLRNVTAQVAAFKVAEQRVLEHPYGRNAALNGLLTKDPFRDGSKMKSLAADHPVLTGGNVDYKQQVVARKMTAMLGEALESFKPGVLKGPPIESAKNFVYELFGSSRGDKNAADLAKGYNAAVDYGQNRVQRAGKIFESNEDWRLPQPWESSRVGRVSEGEYVKWWKDKLAGQGVKLWDDEKKFFAAPGSQRETDILRRAYSDIKTEGGVASAFSKERRTFQFQPGEQGAKAWIDAQQQFGSGDNIISVALGHVEKMAREIALAETLGPNHPATFAALLRRVKEEPGIPGLTKKWAPLMSPATLEQTYKQVSGKGNPVQNETFARVMGSARDLVSIGALRNLPISIIPGDTVMNLLASKHMGMSGYRVIREIFNPEMSKATAAHLQIAAHGYLDFTNNNLRLYQDELNYSGLARKASRAVVRATGAELWTTNGRRGFQTSMLNQIAEATDRPFANLDPVFRDQFLRRYGFTHQDWEAIRQGSHLTNLGVGARYLLDPAQIPEPLYERLLGAVREQGAYAFHQPDARTLAIARGGQPSGSIGGEFWRSAIQYKQFALERMTTHLMRSLIDGDMTNRVSYGLSFLMLSMAAGAVSLQAKQVLGGKDPQDMTRPLFWVDAFNNSGAAGMFSDVIAAGRYGNQSPADFGAKFLGPVPTAASEVANIVNPFKEAPKNKSVMEQRGDLALKFARDHSPATWYTKLATDRLLYDKLQMLIDSDYRKSFKRSEDNAKKFTGADFFWPPGENAPERAPNLGTAIGR